MTTLAAFRLEGEDYLHPSIFKRMVVMVILYTILSLSSLRLAGGFLWFIYVSVMLHKQFDHHHIRKQRDITCLLQLQLQWNSEGPELPVIHLKTAALS